MANVTHEIPAIQAYIALKEGKIALEKAIKVLAMSGLGFYLNKN